jgi:hypothetical protein
MTDETPHATWKSMVAVANRDPDGPYAASVTAAIRRVLDALASEPLAPLAVRDPRSAAELSAAYLQEWHRNAGAA